MYLNITEEPYKNCKYKGELNLNELQSKTLPPVRPSVSQGSQNSQLETILKVKNEKLQTPKS